MTVDWARVHGRSEPPAPAVALRAGPVQAMLDGIDLRYLRGGRSEAVRRIYLAVRDHNWATLPIALDRREIELDDDHFRVLFSGRYCRDAVDFGCEGEIVGHPDGVITLRFDGLANTGFAYNRIGYCLLFPAEAAGRAYRGEAQEGPFAGLLPELVGQQRFEDGVYVALHEPASVLEIDVAKSERVRVELAGDLWETEDQRNWTDASFKTYSTPLRLGFPHRLNPGERVAQQLRISVVGAIGVVGGYGGAGAEPTITIGEPLGTRLPSIGTCLGDDGMGLEAGEIELLRSAGLRHLRIDVSPSDDAAGPALERGSAASQALDCPLEVALFLDPGDETALAALAPQLGQARIARVLVFDRRAATATPHETTDSGLVKLVRRQLPGLAVGGGTNMYFCELNRTRPDATVMDVVSWSVIPQVHAFDERSIVETLTVHGVMVRSARAFSGQTPLAISPLDLLAAANPHATNDGEHAVQGELPAGVDPRQGSLFGAAFTLGSLGELGRAGVASITAFATTGGRGLLQPAAGAPVATFPALPGEVHPLWFVYADLAGWTGAELLQIEVSDPLAVTSLGLRRGDRSRVLVANLSPQQQIVTLRGLPFEAVDALSLDHLCVAAAVRDPHRRTPTRRSAPGGELHLDVGPYAYVRLDEAREGYQ